MFVMSSMDKWNIIVEHFNKNIDKREADVQKTWEQIFSELLGFSALVGDLDPQRVISVGNRGSLRPDIILKKDRKPVCAVELKQERINLTSDIENQLFSYLKQTKLSIGIIVVDKIYIYTYEYSVDDDKQKKITIEFIKDNKLGEKFVELLDQNHFDADGIKSEVDKLIVFNNNINKIKDCINDEVIKEALTIYLLKNYPDAEIKAALNDIKFNINDLSKTITNTVRTPINLKVKPVKIERKTENATDGIESITFMTPRMGNHTLGKFDGHIFTVLKGSEISVNLKGYASDNLRKLRTEYENTGKIKYVDGKCFTTEDISFSSPSGAAEFVIGGNANGWREWKDSKGIGLKEYFNR